MRFLPAGIVGLFLSVVVVSAQDESGTRPGLPVSDQPPLMRDGSLERSSQGFFPVLPWSPLHGWRVPYSTPTHGLQSIAECNFTVAGFVRAEDITACQRLGLAAIIAPIDDDVPWKKPWRDLSDVEIDQRVKKTVEQAGRGPAVMGYFIMDEPGTRDFAALGKAVDAVKRYAPGKLAYINLFPGYATIGAPDKSQLGAASFTEYLERYVDQVKPQFISYDNYMVQYSDDLLARDSANSYFSDLLEVRRIALRHDLPFWNIVSSNQIRNVTTIPSPANMQFQAYTTLAAGGTGVSWYNYYGGSPGRRGYAYAPIDHNGNKTETWGYLQMVNQHLKTLGPIMSGLRSTGVFFSAQAPGVSLPTFPGRLVSTVQATASPRGRAAQTALPIMVGEFASTDGGDYVMVVNLSLERSANIRVDTPKAYANPEVISAQDGHAVTLDLENGLWLTAGQGALIRLR
jgi:hypothetical protein